MNPYVKEVVDVHIAIENWLGKGEGDVEALLTHFDPAFSMIAIGGAKLNFAALSAFFHGQPAAKPGLNIALADIKVVTEWPGGAVVSYSEKQTLPGRESTQRYSTVVFTGSRWKHLHETAAI